jgi:hypothetical protein
MYEIVNGIIIFNILIKIGVLSIILFKTNTPFLVVKYADFNESNNSFF